MEPSEKPKRRLPVLQNTEVAAEGDEERPPWHWSAIGAVAIFVLWLPLAFLSAALGEHLLRGVAAAGVHLLSFTLAAFGGGAIVGRFGVKAGLKEATVSGLATPVLACLAAVVSGAPLSLLAAPLVVLIAAGAGASRLGGWIGLRARLSGPRR